MNANFDVMVDLETLSTQPNAVICTLGAIKFSRSAKRDPNMASADIFYKRIQIDSCRDLDMHISGATISWWMNQEPAAREEAFNINDRFPLKQVLIEFSDWLGEFNTIWSHGKDFDCVILAEAYRLCKLECPWKYWQTRDTRTIYDLAHIKTSDLPSQHKHHALYDCLRQISGVQAAIRKLYKINKDRPKTVFGSNTQSHH